jgi:glycosyltransferase involved in cell wall biosynthesis
MRVLIATDAWHPQVNGVVRTLLSLRECLRGLGVTPHFLTPDGFPSIAVPTYPGLRCALPSPREIARRIEEMAPDAIHIATEGPIGHIVRRYCLAQGLPFTTSYTTRYPEYIAARFPLPEALSYAYLRRFHAPARVTMVATKSLMAELAGRGFQHLAIWTRGVDTELFKPERAIELNLPRPRFVSVGRVAVEKNLEAFVGLDLPGSKIVIGSGPQEAELRRRSRMRISWGSSKASISPPISLRPTCWCFPAGRTHSETCSSRRWPAGCPWRPTLCPVRATLSAAPRWVHSTTTSTRLAWQRSGSLVRRAGNSRFPAPGSTARASSWPT